MLICTILLIPFYVLLFIVTQVIQTIVTTVCNWVSSILTTIVTVVNQICGYLPWPLNKLCKLVSTLITVVQTVWNYICNTIIQTIIIFVTIVISFLIWLVRFICYYVTLPLNLPNLILCRLGLTFPKYIKVCIKILTDSNGNPAITVPQAMTHIAWTNDIFKNCNIQLVVCNIEFVSNEKCINNVTCNPLSIFTKCFAWFTQNACSQYLTVYFVNSIQGNASGCSYLAGANFVVINPSPANEGALAQEIGHTAGLGHSSDPNNFMCEPCNFPAPNITKYQCCILRIAPFTSVVRECI